MLPNIERLSHSLFAVDVYDPYDDFSQIKEQIELIDRACFPQTYTKRKDTHHDWFSNPTNIVVILRTTDNKVIGFSIARQKIEGRDLPADTCNVSLTAILPDYQKNGLAGLLMTRLKQELRNRGYLYWERNLAVENKWNEAFIDNENDNIVILEKPRMTEFGIKQYVKCKL